MAAFSKRHYEAIAASIRHIADVYRFDPEDGTLADGARYAHHAQAHGLADTFATDNPNFNRARFLKACGVEG